MRPVNLPLAARRTMRAGLTAGATLVAVATACDATGPQELATRTLTAAAAAAAPAPATGIVDVTSTGMDLVAPAEVQAGWTTFRFHNRSGVTHFFVLERMPPGRTVDDARREVVPVFQDAMDLIVAGDAEAGLAEFARLPAWFFQVQFTGGPGLVAPGLTGETTVYLEPGTYSIECYVKTADGVFHSAMGMIEGLVVSETVSPARPPKPTLQVRIGEGGLAIDGELRPGRHTIAVHFADQTAHEHFLGHDVHLARLPQDADLAQLEAWMDWSAPAGLAAPAPVEFLGGAQEMPAGSTAFFTALLTPGRYAFVAEVPGARSKNMLQTFEVPGTGTP